MHSRVVETLLLAADSDAGSGNYRAALGWLAVVEQLNLVIPTEYVVRRDDWRRRLDPKLDFRRGGRPDRRALCDRGGGDQRPARRIGWLREIEARTGGEMESHLVDLERDIEELIALSRKTGTSGRKRRAGTR